MSKPTPKRSGVCVRSNHNINPYQVLRLETTNGYRGWLITMARVFRQGPSGLEHTLRDFRQSVDCSSIACSPQNAQRQHSQALDELDQLMEQIAQHYANAGNSVLKAHKSPNLVQFLRQFRRSAKP